MVQERQFFEIQALDAALVEAKGLLGDDVVKELASDLPVTAATDLNRALADLFGDRKLADCVTVRPEVSPPEYIESFYFRLSRTTVEGQTQKMRFYRAQSVWKTQAASFVAIALAIALVPVNPLSAFSTIPPAITILSTAWDRLVTLERPHDDRAIDAYEALLKCGLDSRRRGDPGPTASEINAATGQPDFDRTLAGLKRLKDLDLVEIVAWELQSGDVDAPGNRWFQRF